MSSVKEILERALKSSSSEEKHLAEFIADLLEEEPGNYDLLAESMEVFIDIAIVFMRAADKER